MTNIFNTDNLYWVFTKYANKRLADFDADDNMKLYKIKIGDYNWYTDEEHKLGDNGYTEAAFKSYYQDEYRDELGHFITGENSEGDTNYPLSFDITNKELDRTNETVILSALISEDFGGFDIREVGIYEIFEDEEGVVTDEKLFAVCTMQPMPKPGINTNHYISTEIACHLCSQRLVTHFDNIEIDKRNNYVTKPEIHDYQTNLLFVEANLAEQISRNSQLIGYNRVQQLYELIKDNQDNFSRFSYSAIYSNLANVVNVKNFWTFNSSGALSRKAMIRDLSLNNENLIADQLSTKYERGFEGISAWLNFSNSHYYALEAPSDIKSVTVGDVKEYYAPNRDDLTFIDLHKDQNNKIISVSDSAFSIIFVGAQNDNSDTNTILCKYNTFAEHPGLSVSVTKDRELKIVLYTNMNSYVTFSTPRNSIPRAGEFYVLIADYNGDQSNPKVTVNINGESVTTTPVNTGTPYKGMSLAGILLPMFSFERTGDGDKKYINSKVCLLSLLKGTLSDKYKQAVMYNLVSLIGNNPCLV